MEKEDSSLIQASEPKEDIQNNVFLLTLSLMSKCGDGRGWSVSDQRFANPTKKKTTTIATTDILYGWAVSWHNR